MFKKITWAVFAFGILSGLMSHAADEVRIQGPIIQWHDLTTEASFSWAQRLSAEETEAAKWLEGTAGFGYGDDERVYIAKIADGTVIDEFVDKP